MECNELRPPVSHLFVYMPCRKKTRYILKTIFSGFYRSTGIKTSRIVRVGTRNYIIRIAVVSQGHVLVSITRKETPPVITMVFVSASKLTSLLCGWSRWTWFQCGGSELTWFQCGDHSWFGFVWGSKVTWFWSLDRNTLDFRVGRHAKLACF